MPFSVKMKVRNLLLLSCAFIVVAALCSMIYGRIVIGFFTLRFVFPAIFMVGSIVIIIGVVVLMLPVRPRLKDNKLIDHSNYVSTVMMRREKKRATAYDTLYLGMGIVIIAAVMQFVLSLII